MIRRSIGLLVAVMFAISIMSVALARGAPPGKRAFTQAVAVETAPTIVANVAPVMTGYDVIQNLTTGPRVSNTMNAVRISVTTARRGLSPTGYWRASSRSGGTRNKSAPRIVMLA